MVESDTSSLRRYNHREKLLRLADQLERRVGRYKSREVAGFYAFIIMGIRHPEQLASLVEEHPNNQLALQALNALNELTLESITEFMSEHDLA